MIANEMANITNALFKVYLIMDLEKADKIASTEYNGQIATSHVAKVYVDQTQDIYPRLCFRRFHWTTGEHRGEHREHGC